MPKPGETIREGLVVQWMKKEGEKVEEKDPLVELETEKAVFTFESPFRGVLKKILAAEGENKPVASPLALFEVSEEDGNRYLMFGVGMPVDSAPSPSSQAPSQKTSGQKQKTKDQGLGTRDYSSYSPLIRNMAREHGMSSEELDEIPRSGDRLTKEDVLKFVQGRGGSRTAPTTEEFDRIPLSPIRQRIAKHMIKSHREIPQAASSVDVDLSPILQFKKDHGEEFLKKHGLSLTPFYFFLYAVREILKKFPTFNSSYIEENGKAFTHQYRSIHLGFAVARRRAFEQSSIRQSI